MIKILDNTTNSLVAVVKIITHLPMNFNFWIHNFWNFPMYVAWFLTVKLKEYTYSFDNCEQNKNILKFDGKWSKMEYSQIIKIGKQRRKKKNYIINT